MLNFDSFTKDPDLLKKILIGSLLTLSIIGMVPVMGWSIEILRRNTREENPPLPDWDNLGGYIQDGLKGIALVLIWSLPIAIPIIGISVGAIFLPEFFASEEDAG